MPRKIERASYIIFLFALVCGVSIQLAPWVYESARILSDQGIGIDDANIYFRYAHNISHGHGIVWNPGGERVEGVSSLLWVFMCAAAYTFFAAPELFLLQCNIMFLAVAVSIVAATMAYVVTARSHTTRKWWGVSFLSFAVTVVLLTFVALRWMYVNPAFISWAAATLMETGLWALLITALGCALTMYISSGLVVYRRGIYVLMLLVSACRPEGPLLSLVATGLLLVSEHMRSQSLKESFRRWIMPVVMGGVSIGGPMLVRYIYFGFPFPNTYYAKVEGDFWYNWGEGKRYLRGTMEHYPVHTWLVYFLGIAGALAAVWLLVTAFRRRREGGQLACVPWIAIVAAGVFVPLYCGGDHFGSWRFLQPYCLALFAGVLMTVHQLMPRRIPAVVRGFGLCAVGWAIASAHANKAVVTWDNLAVKSVIKHEFALAEKGRLFASQLNSIFKNYPTKPTIGVLVVGGIGHTYQGPINDMLALNNVEMAHASSERKYIKNHAAFNKEVFLRQKPTFLFFMAEYCSQSAPKKLLEVDGGYRDAMKHVQATPAFQSLYVPVMVWDEELASQGKGICGYALQEELAQRVGVFEFKAL